MAHNSSNERIGATKTTATRALRLLPSRTLRELCAVGLPQPVLDIDTASTAGGNTPCPGCDRYSATRSSAWCRRR